MAEQCLSRQAHWDGVYARRGPRAASWYEPAPEILLALIDQAGIDPDAPIVDVGGGAPGLAAALLADGVRADVRSHDFGRRYALWQDRAVFHFMVSTAERDAYPDALRRTLAPGGYVVFATFGPAGPTRCSGLPTRRHDTLELTRLLGADFHPIASRLHEHTTPREERQQFLYLLARRTPRP